MSRSRKKRPGGGIAIADSDKPFKVIEHRRERRQAYAALKGGEDPPAVVYGNPWKAPKDGKTYWVDPDPKWMRK
jgi:hypothetical protein